MIPHILFKLYNSVDACVMKVSKTDIDEVAHIAALKDQLAFMKDEKKTGWVIPDSPGLFLLIYNTRRFDKFGPIPKACKHGFKAQLNSWCSKLRQRNVKCMPESRETLLLKFLELHSKDVTATYVRHTPEVKPDAASALPNNV
jgi:hypothetical protein